MTVTCTCTSRSCLDGARAHARPGSFRYSRISALPRSQGIELYIYRERTAPPLPFISMTLLSGALKPPDVPPLPHKLGSHVKYRGPQSMRKCDYLNNPGRACAPSSHEQEARVHVTVTRDRRRVHEHKLPAVPAFGQSAPPRPAPRLQSQTQLLPP